MADISRRLADDAFTAMTKDDPARRRAAPQGAPGMDVHGRVWRIVRWVDAQKGAFAISRLIMQTGIKLRDFRAETPDDPRVLARLWPALESLLAPEEREALLQSLQDPF